MSQLLPKASKPLDKHTFIQESLNYKYVSICLLWTVLGNQLMDLMFHSCLEHRV